MACKPIENRYNNVDCHACMQAWNYNIEGHDTVNYNIESDPGLYIDLTGR